MIGHLMTSLRIFAAGRPGLRFRDNYRLRQSWGRGTFHPARISYLAVGAALIVGSALFGWMPVLGWSTAILGLGMIAGEFYPVARLMDRMEPRARMLFKPLGKKLARLPVWKRLSVLLGVGLASFVVMYGLFSTVFGS
jgi:hypothetical protein